MTDFNKMTASELDKELERYQIQLLKQQAEKIPITEAQKRRFYALRKAWRVAWDYIAK